MRCARTIILRIESLYFFIQIVRKAIYVEGSKLFTDITETLKVDTPIVAVVNLTVIVRFFILLSRDPLRDYLYIVFYTMMKNVYVIVVVSWYFLLIICVLR